MTDRVELTNLYPRECDEPMDAWTGRLLTHAKTHGTYRQCSIGWHGECSQRDLGAEGDCNCICHAEGVGTYTVEGHAEGGGAVVTRAEEGKHFWPPKQDEPESAWARWVLATSLEEAQAQAKTAEDAKIAQEKETHKHDLRPEPGLISSLLTKCRDEVAEYKKEGPTMSDYDQLAAAGRAEFAEEIINIIEGKAS